MDPMMDGDRGYERDRVDRMGSREWENERPRHRDRDQERSRRHSHSRDNERDRERDRDRDYERTRHERRDSTRERERERPRDRDRDREWSSSGRDRDSYRENEYMRSRGSGDLEHRSSTARERPSFTSYAFSRPATYDPRLAQKTLHRQHHSAGFNDDDSYEEIMRKKQLKDELGFSDDEQLNASGDDKSDEDIPLMTSAHGRSYGKQRSGREAEPHGKLEKALNELRAAKDNEQRAQDSLSKLQLLSRSQTAILKTTMTKKLQEKDLILEEMVHVIRDLEGRLGDAGVVVQAYTAPNLEGSSSSTSASESEAIAEISAMKAEMDKLIDENNQLKLKLSQHAPAQAGDRPNNNAPTIDMDNMVSKAKLDALASEKQKLAQAYKEAQQKISSLQAQLRTEPTKESTVVPPVPPPSMVDDSKLDELRQKLRDSDKAAENATRKIAKLEKELQEAKSIQAKAASDLQKATSAAQQESCRSEAQLQAKVETLTSELTELKAQLEKQQKEAKTKETAMEEKNAKLKATAEAELSKIKEQAKKAILDLKRKLDSSSKTQQKKASALGNLQLQLRKQKTDLATLKSQITNQNQQFPVMAKQLADKVTQRIQKQADAMAGVVENYKREMKERKRLFNLVQELKGNIRVLCRFRPISKSEIANGSKMVCKFNGEQDITLVGDKGKMKTWEFDRVFDMNSTQEQLFSEVKPLVTSILDGYSVCIFAYGQTGSGKTFTMSGPAENPGINTRSLQELFQRKVSRAKEYQDDINVSVMEIYNEQIRDLLAENASSTNLQVRQGPTGNFVPGLTMIPVQTIDEVFELIKRGNKNRSTHATDMNEHSSRSHSILSIQLKSTNLVTNAVATGKLFLVDLAGSERLSKTGAEGQRLKEAQNINKSLSALGDVIAARAGKAKHVPYRNSSLTYLLQDALGGDSKTLMVACASPVDYNSEESFCTLNFAARARSVEMGKATRNITNGSSKD